MEAGSASKGKRGFGAWWEVDLGGLYSVASVEVYNHVRVYNGVLTEAQIAAVAAEWPGQ